MDRIEQSRIWDERLNQYAENLYNKEKNRPASGYENDYAAYNRTVSSLKELYNLFYRNKDLSEDKKDKAINDLNKLEERDVYLWKNIIQSKAEEKLGKGKYKDDEVYDKITLSEIMEDIRKKRFDHDFWADKQKNYNNLGNDKPKLR